VHTKIGLPYSSFVDWHNCCENCCQTVDREPLTLANEADFEYGWLAPVS
jgi:hypothetical protein